MSAYEGVFAGIRTILGGSKMYRDVFVTLHHKDVTIVQNLLIDCFYVSMLRKGNCKKIIINISKSTSHLWIILWIIMLYGYEIVFPGIRTIQHCHI